MREGPPPGQGKWWRETSVEKNVLYDVEMSLTPMDRFRRRLGLFFLGTAAGMTWLGLTSLESRLRGIEFLLYWAVGGGSALAAFACALIDMRVMRERIDAERQTLAQKCFAITRAPPDNPPRSQI